MGPSQRDNLFEFGRTVMRSGPTPEFVRWSIDQNCALREPIDSSAPDDVDRYLRPLREIGECQKNGAVMDGVCLVPPESGSAEWYGCFLDEIAAFYGSLSRCYETCGPCPANVDTNGASNDAAAEASGLAGCFGWLVRDDAIVKRLHDAVSENSPQRNAPENKATCVPPWYEIWTSNKLEGSRLQWVVDLFGRVVDRSQSPIDWVRFHSAASVCCQRRWSLSVDFVPAGRVEHDEWIVGPYCPRCRGRMDVQSRRCAKCGHQGGPHPEIRRKVLGRRPFRKLESLVGVARAAELSSRMQSAMLQRRRSGNE